MIYRRILYRIRDYTFLYFFTAVMPSLVLLTLRSACYFYPLHLSFEHRPLNQSMGSCRYKVYAWRLGWVCLDFSLLFFPFFFSSLVFLNFSVFLIHFRSRGCYILLCLKILRPTQTWNNLLKEKKSPTQQNPSLNCIYPIQANSFTSGNFKHPNYLGQEYYADRN